MCQARYPSANNAKEINYKTAEKGATLKMKSAEIKTIRYFLKDDNVVEKEFLTSHNNLNTYSLQSKGIIILQKKYEKKSICVVN